MQPDMHPTSIPQLLATQAQRTPAGSALLAPGRVPLTYRALADQVTAVAARLNRLGVGRNDRIAIVLPNGPQMALAFLSVAATATSAPLNPAYSAAEFDFYLSDLDAKAVVVMAGDDSPVLAAARARSVPVFELTPAPRAAAGLFTLSGDPISRRVRAGPAQPDDVALVLHTSGTTSRPKMVPLTHRNLCASAASIRQSLQLAPNDRCLNVMPLFHIHGLAAAVLASLSAGASVVCTPGFDAPLFFSWLDTFQPTWFTAVPAMHQAILARAATNESSIAGARLRFIRSCSAALPGVLMAELEHVFGVPVIEAYGMTEASHQMACNPLPPGIRKPGSVGLAAGPEVRIMAEVGEVLRRPGEIGEIVIRGPNVMSGYADNPEANAGAFTNGWFRTGDQGYIDEDGYIFITGRLKEIINRGGEKISPREVDEVLLTHPAVAQAVTFAMPDAQLGEDVAAAIVPRQTGVTEKDLRRFVSRRLAPFKVPRRILVVDEIPKGPTGKVQRIGLAGRLGLAGAPPAAAPAPAEFVAPRTGSERLLAEMWRDVLRLERVGVYDCFLDAGGDSLLATRLVSLLCETLDINFTLLDFFDAPTIAGQAVIVERMLLDGFQDMPEEEAGSLASGERTEGGMVDQGTTSTPDINQRIAQLSPAKRALLEQRLRERQAGSADRAIARRKEAGSYPVSFAQQRLWFIDQIEPGNTAYNVSRVYKLSGAIHAPTLERSFCAIAQRHEALRTTLQTVDGQPVQVIASSIELPLVVIDLQNLPACERQNEAQRRCNQEIHRPFDMAAGSLIRTSLYKLDAQEHILHVVMHHVATDGWSMELLFRELASLYNAFISGAAPALPDLPIQYADFALWQRAEVAGERLSRLAAYWTDKLRAVPTLELPTDRPRPAVQTFNGTIHEVALPEPLAESLKMLSRRTGCTPFMTLLAAFAVLLHRYSGQEDIAIASPIANRTRPELESLIGFFVNMLVLRVDLSGDPTFLDLLQRVRQTALGAYAHQDMPFERLVEELHPDRALSRAPLFQVSFNYLNTPEYDFELDGIVVERLPIEPGGVIFDLGMVIQEKDNCRITCTLQYDSDLFDRATVVRMLGHYQVLLESIITGASQHVSTLPLMTPAEREQILVQWNNTQTAYPRDACIARLFEEEAERQPDAVALVYGDSKLTYRELNMRANRLARYLQKLGVGLDVPVGVCLGRSPEMIISLLGILKAGGAYVPLDPGYRAARLAFILQDTNLRMVLTEQRLLDRLPAGAFTAICLDTRSQTINEQSAENLQDEACAHNLAYIMYTSGSSGQPKGTAIPQRAVVRLVKATNYVTLGRDDVLLQFAPLSFDASTFEIWGSLLNGAKLVLHAEQLPSLEDLGKIIQREQVTTLWLTAGLFQQMVESQLDALQGLRQFLAGGDVLSVPHVRAALEHPHKYRLINGYGPTENTTFTCCYGMSAPAGAAQSVPIGRPIANTQVYILDRHLQPVPVGVPGELCIAGDGLAWGYWNRPELTAEKFIANPFAAGPGERLYRSGDLARFLPDGNIEFLGRIDNQVKIRGFRVEPGEIEYVLSLHPGVREAVVVAHNDTMTGKRLIAYVVPSSPPPDIDELRAFLIDKLPDYMIPSAFVVIDALPLTANGKVDRRALPAPDQALPAGNKFALPRDALEQQLAAIWEDVLNVRPIGIGDSFFDLGGHSLLAMRLFARMEKAFGKQLPVAMLFRAPTIEQFAAAMSTTQPGACGSTLVPIQNQGSLPPFFCVHGFGGGVVGYAALSRLLGPEQPFYGLQARGADGGARPQASIEDMAASYLQAVRSLQPRGPYLLGGYCYGGIVAYEMARQLEQRGEQVAHLALFEASAPNAPLQPRSLTTAWSFLRNLPYWLRDFWLRAESDAPLLLRLQLKVGAAWRAVNRHHKDQPQPVVDRALAGAAAPVWLQDLMRVHLAAARAYQPQPYHGRVTLYRVRALPFFKAGDPTRGWGRLAEGGLEIKMVAGAHYNLLDLPYVENLAAQLKQSLERARQGPAQ